MGSVYLILYLWHATFTTDPKAIGGPQLSITRVDSLSACEALGKAAKELADAARPEPRESLDATYWWRHLAFTSPPASFRCVVVR